MLIQLRTMLIALPIVAMSIGCVARIEPEPSKIDVNVDPPAPRRIDVDVNPPPPSKIDVDVNPPGPRKVDVDVDVTPKP